MGRLTGVALLAEAIWFAGGTLVAVPYIRTSASFEGGPEMSTGEVVAAYIVGFGLAALFGVTGVILARAVEQSWRVARWFVLAAAVANGCLAIITAYTALTTRAAFREPFLGFLITGVAALLCLYCWWPRSRQVLRH
ncbi:MAG: hypothetical protein M3P18_21520 [Actinomycetota bacterium]|nr:hypothetical protein [Actinomycetota bacterium]